MKLDHYVKKDIGFKVGDSIDIKIEVDPYNLELPVTYKGKAIRSITSNVDAIRIIRAYNSGYKMETIIRKINYGLWDNEANSIIVDIKFLK